MLLGDPEWETDNEVITNVRAKLGSKAYLFLRKVNSTKFPHGVDLSLTGRRKFVFVTPSGTPEILHQRPLSMVVGGYREVDL